MSDWDFEENKPSDVTLKELTQLCKDLKEKREDKTKAEKVVSNINSEIAKVQGKVIEYLTEYGMKNFSGEFGTVTRTKRYSVRQPNTPEKKEAFYKYLKERGDFENLISVNSRTLASYVKQEIEAKKEDGQYDWVPPGIDTPETVETLSIRKK